MHMEGHSHIQDSDGVIGVQALVIRGHGDD